MLEYLSLLYRNLNQIFTVRKGSLGQGNVLLASIILFKTEVWDLCMMSLPVWLPGPMVLLGGLPDRDARQVR